MLSIASAPQYFAAVFESPDTPAHTMLYIVMPPELSKRAIHTLIQYMYSGVTTVSTDILNEVIRGGEMLKIRGIWRNGPHILGIDSAPFVAILPKDDSVQLQLADIPLPPPPPPPPIELPNAHLEQQMYTIDHGNQMVASLARSSTPAPASSIPMLPDHIDMMAMPSTSHQADMIMPSTSHQAVSQHHSPHSTTSTFVRPTNYSYSTQMDPPPTQSHQMLVKKEELLDPEEMAAAISSPLGDHYSHLPHTVTSTSQNMQYVEHGNQNNPGRDDVVAKPRRTRCHDSLIGYNEDVDHLAVAREANLVDEPEELETGSSDQRQVTSTKQEHVDGHRHLDPDDKNIAPTQYASSPNGCDGPLPDAFNFLSIKHEPLDWCDYESEFDRARMEINVKPELIYGDSTTDEEGMNRPNIKFMPIFNLGHVLAEEEIRKHKLVYSPLTCELCRDTFTIPADWVRHIQCHAEASPHCVPKKRKRIEVSCQFHVSR